MLVPRRERNADGDQSKEDELPAAPQAERAPVRELDEGVEETDRATAQRHVEHRERGKLVLRDGEERGGRDDEDEESAHRRRALLAAVPLGQLLPDLLPELVAAEERDEARTNEDRDNHRDPACAKDPDQAAGPLVSASATASRPTARAAFPAP